MVNINNLSEKRKYLHNRLCRVNDIKCFFAFFGIILMIINNEIIFSFRDNEKMMINWIIKLIISILTVLLLGLIVYYYKLDLDLYSIRSSANDWRIVLRGKKIVLMLLEMIICSIHPFPRNLHSNSSSNSTIPTIDGVVPIFYTSLDVALGLPMFARLYLMCRLVMFHSPLAHNALSQSLGSLNQVSIDFFLIIKTYLERWPTRCLITLCTTIFLIGSWCLRACTYDSTLEHISILDSMWLFIVTYTTVGYGDLTPSTYCGRTVATFIALSGTLFTALLISVVANKLVLTRWEKYLYNFVLNVHFGKERKIQTANVIKFAVKVWYLGRKNQSKSIQCLQAKWKLFRSINSIQEVKLEQRKLMDNWVGLADLYTIQQNGYDQMETLVKQMNTMKIIIKNIEEKFLQMNQMINVIQYKVNRSL